MICPKCGKEFEGLCLNCTNLEDLVWIEDLVVTMCPRCSSYKIGGKWKKVELEEVVEEIILKSARIHPELDVEEVTIRYDPFTITFKGKVSNKNVEITKHPNLRIVRETCLKCSREAGGYYESILQLRADSRDLEDKEISRVNEIIDEVLEAERDNQKAFITKVVERKEGIDYFFGGRDIGRKISRKIANEFGAEIKESKTISGRFDGRDLYRFTYLVRLPFYKKGDVVKDNGKICVVTNVKLKKGVDVKSMHNVTLKNPKLIAKRNEIKRGIVVQKDRYAVELIDFETNKIVVAEKTAEVDIGDEIYIIECDDKFYAIPKELIAD